MKLACRFQFSRADSETNEAKVGIIHWVFFFFLNMILVRYLLWKGNAIVGLAAMQHSQIQLMSRLQQSNSLLFKSLQMKSGPRAKVQQPGTLDQSAHKKTALIQNFSGHLEPWGLLLNL